MLCSCRKVVKKAATQITQYIKEVKKVAITIDFPKEFADLICTDIPKMQIEEYPNGPQIPKKYRKKFIHPENGFVKQFCEEYDEPTNGFTKNH